MKKTDQLGGNIGADCTHSMGTHTGHSKHKAKASDPMVQMKFTAEEQDIMDGKKGPLLQKSIKTIIAYGQLFGADSLVDLDHAPHLAMSWGTDAVGPFLKIYKELADAALMEAIHAHLGRDAYPAPIMKKTAPALFRWTETMNYGHYVQDAELSQVPQKYLDADNLPKPLMDFLKLMAADFGPLFEANAKAYEAWLIANPNAPEGTRVTNDQSRMNRQAMGRAVYKLQGVTIKRDAWPDTVNMHQYVLEVVDAMSAKDKARWTKLMKSIGGEVFLGHRPSRPVVLQSEDAPYQIVLGPKVKK